MYVFVKPVGEMHEMDCGIAGGFPHSAIGCPRTCIRCGRWATSSNQHSIRVTYKEQPHKTVIRWHCEKYNKYAAI